MSDIKPYPIPPPETPNARRRVVQTMFRQNFLNDPCPAEMADAFTAALRKAGEERVAVVDALWDDKDKCLTFRGWGMWGGRQV